MRRLLFQLHLWAGLILGLVLLLLGLTGSLVMLRPLVLNTPKVTVTQSESAPALDKGLAAARAALNPPARTNTTITLPQAPDEAVRIHFATAAGPAAPEPLPDVLTDPASGKILATYVPRAPAWLRLAADFHGHLSMPNGRLYEGAFGVAMLLMGLSGLYLWWPRRGQWKNAFIVRRQAKGLRFHRELHGAVGIWLLPMFLILAWSGTSICYPMMGRGVITALSGGGPTLPRQAQRAPDVTAPAGVAPVGPDRLLAAARAAHAPEPIVTIQLPARRDQAASVVSVLPGNLPLYIDPYSGMVVASAVAAPTRVDEIQRFMGRLHEAIALGPVYWLLVFLSGLTLPLFFITGLVMWWKKRQNRMAMTQPLPQDL